MSLTNTDYKIIAFVFARRLQTILDKLISKDQTAYVKGRFIGENARLILDIFEYCENNDQEGILLFLDFEKAFDSVEWNFLLKTLKKFNFGNNFIEWIKILYTNPIFRIKNNGWVSKTCKMTRGIRQGCPISAILYLFVAEILSIKIKGNENIEGFTCRNMNKDVKTIQHADDLTMALKNIDSLRQAITTIENFCKHAGSKVNIAKTECILLGPLKDRYTNIQGINVNDKCLKCLGIYIGHDKEECYNKNWMNVYHEMEKLFETWKKRKLTIFGKCCIINTLAISKLIYRATVLNLPDCNYIKSINKLIYTFMWNKTDRIKRNTLIGPVHVGGIGIVDIETKINALKASWVSRILQPNSNIYNFLNSLCMNNNITVEYILKTNETNVKDFTLVHNMPLFYQEVFSCFNQCKKGKSVQNMSSCDLMQQPIWNNKQICFKGKTIEFTNWIKSGILYVKDLFDENGNFIDLAYLSNVLHNKNNWLCEYKCIKSIFRKLGKHFHFENAKFVNIRQTHHYYFMNGLHNVMGQRCNFYYNILLMKKFRRPCYQTIVARDLNIQDKKCWTNIYLNKVKDISDTKVAEFNYKLLNNILCNNYLVSKWNPTVKKECTVCGAIEITKHLIFECTNVKNIWTILGFILNFEVQWKHVLVGFYYEKSEKVSMLNNLISYVACRMYKYKMFCRLETLEESEYAIRYNLKSSLKFYTSVLKHNKCMLQSKYFEKLSNAL